MVDIGFRIVCLVIDIVLDSVFRILLMIVIGRWLMFWCIRLLGDRFFGMGCGGVDLGGGLCLRL